MSEKNNNKYGFEEHVFKYSNMIHASLMQLNVSNKTGIVKTMTEMPMFRSHIVLHVAMVGEFFKRSEVLKRDYPSFDWKRAYKARNIISHGYEDAPLFILANIVFDHILPLRDEMLRRQYTGGTSG